MSLTIKRKYEIIMLGKLRAGVVEDSLEEVSLGQDFKEKDFKNKAIYRSITPMWQSCE